MLQLNPEQVQRLQAIKLERDTASLAQALAAGFPDVPGRLGERYGLLVAHGVQRGARHGLLHTVCVARYLACWFMLGAEFETKPGFEWAAEILSSTRRDEGAKVFQLCRRVREELSRPATPGAPAMPAPAAFDAAIAQLDLQLMPRGALGSLLPPQRVQLGEACDIDALDLRLPEAAPAHRYQLVQGQWQRLPVTGSAAPITLNAGTAARPAALPLGATAAPPPALAARLTLLAPPGGHPARLRLRTRSATCCDPAVHPVVTLNGSQGLTTWRGPHAADILFSLPAALPATAADEGLQPRIAVEGATQLSLLTLASCGLRDSGTSLGELNTQLAVLGGEQHLVAWRRDAGPALELPQDTTPPTPATSRIRVERDGLPLDTLRWQAALEDLDRQLHEGLGRLATAWERETGVSQARLQAEPRVMCGSAGLTWGWAEGAQGMASPPLFRVAGSLDLVACQLALRLSGTLKLRGSLSRISLHCAGSHLLQSPFDGAATGPELLAVLAAGATRFTLPLVLQVQALAQDDLAMLDMAGAVVGSLQGQCGLRQRPDGPGLQWFAKLTLDPVSVRLQLHDPLLGSREHVQPLLPALTLLDWSMG
jgi:hypothetical protein